MPRRVEKRDYEPPPPLMAAWQHPRTRRIHFRNECQAMKYDRAKLQVMLIRSDLSKLPGEPCRFCFGQ